MFPFLMAHSVPFEIGLELVRRTRGRDSNAVKLPLAAPHVGESVSATRTQPQTTYVSNRKISAPTELIDGDEVRLGTICMRFRLVGRGYTPRTQRRRH